MKKLLFPACLILVFLAGAYAESAFVKDGHKTVFIGMSINDVTRIFGKPINVFEEKYSADYIHAIYVYRGIEIGCFKKHFRKTLENVVTDIRVDSDTYTDFLGNSVGKAIQSQQKTGLSTGTDLTFDFVNVPDSGKPLSDWKSTAPGESGSVMLLRVNYHLNRQKIQIIMVSIIGDSI